MTLPETLLWLELRKRPGGLKFRRQHPIGRFIADFYCPVARLIVEVDGVSHELGSAPEYDRRRDIWLRDNGLKVLRIRAVDVIRDVESVISSILEAARELPLHHAVHGSPPHGIVGRN